MDINTDIYREIYITWIQTHLALNFAYKILCFSFNLKTQNNTKFLKTTTELVISQIFFNKRFNFCYVYRQMFCPHMCVPRVWLDLDQARGQHLTSWNWGYGRLCAVMWVLELNPGSEQEQPMSYSPSHLSSPNTAKSWRLTIFPACLHCSQNKASYLVITKTFASSAFHG